VAVAAASSDVVGALVANPFPVVVAAAVTVSAANAVNVPVAAVVVPNQVVG